MAAVCLDGGVESVRGFRALWIDASLLDAVGDAWPSRCGTAFGFPRLRLVARRLIVVPRTGA